MMFILIRNTFFFGCKGYFEQNPRYPQLTSYKYYRSIQYKYGLLYMSSLTYSCTEIITPLWQVHGVYVFKGIAILVSDCFFWIADSERTTPLNKLHHCLFSSFILPSIIDLHNIKYGLLYMSSLTYSCTEIITPLWQVHGVYVFKGIAILVSNCFFLDC